MLEDKIYVDGELFLGRHEEQKEFRQALRDVLNKELPLDTPYIFLIEGAVGMGKSKLLRRLRDIAARELPYETAVQTMLFDWRHKSTVRPARLSYDDPEQPNYIFGELYQAARDAGWGHQFADYQDTLRRLDLMEKQVLEAVEQEVWKSEFGAIRLLSTEDLIAILRAGDQPEVRSSDGAIQFVENTDDPVDDDFHVMARKHAEDWYSNQGFFEPEQDSIFLHPNYTLAKLIGLGFAKQSQTKPLILLLDAYELAGSGEGWIRVVMRHAGSRVIWVIAREKADKLPSADVLPASLGSISDRLKIFEVAALTDEQTASYLQDRAPDRLVTRNSVEQVFAVTRGIPLGLQLAGDLWAGGVPIGDLTEGISPDAADLTILETLSQRLLDFCSDPEDRKTLVFLAIQPRPNENVFSSILQPRKGSYEMQARIRMLTSRYKAIRANGVLEIHHLVADFIRGFLLRRRIRVSEEVSALASQAAIVTGKLRDHYENNFPRLEDRFENEDWRVVMIDCLYWTFLKNEFDGWRQINRDFIDAVGYDLIHAQLMVRVVERIESLLSKNGQQRLLVYQAGLATQIANRRGENPTSLGELDGQISLLAELERWLTRYGGKDIYATERRAILDLRRGELFYRYGQYEDALKMFLNAEKNLPVRGTALNRLLAADFELVGEKMAWQWDGNRILEAQASPRAETSLRKAIALGRRRAKAFHALGAVQVKLGKSDHALENLLQAVTLNPENGQAWFDLGEVYRGQKLFEKSVPAYKRAIGLEAQFVRARLALAICLRELAQEDALQAELHLIKRFVRNESEYHKACYEALAGNLDQAVLYLETSLKKDQATLEMVRREPCFDSLRSEERFLILSSSS
jgi:tetratricopeptide (TPR) repeat protein